MGSHPVDPQTDQQSDPLARSGVAARSCPTVAWTDTDGAHEVSIEGRVVVGSAAGVDLRIADTAVSRLHAELELLADGLWVRDLGSRNGTFVQGVLVQSARVPDNATIRMGSTDLAVSYSRIPLPIELWPSSSFGPLVGASVVMRELFARLERVAATDATVLIQGETGTGKELVARAIHEASPRASGPLVIIDCASLPETLLEAELFGHTRGAFTGALTARTGVVEAAHRGTVLLDEVGELPMSMQPKLLRAIESRTVRRVGETSYRAIDVRFLSATHRNLRQMVNDGTFREDLYFRLAAVPITIPPLRARPQDIRLLVEQFLPAERRAGAISPELLVELESKTWPGNVRELRNFVDRAVAFGAADALTMTSNDAADGAGEDALPPVPMRLMSLPITEARERWIVHFEREYVRQLLRRHDHNVSAAAQSAGVNRSYFHRLIRKHTS